MRTVDLRKPEAAPVDKALVPAPAVEAISVARRKPRARSAGEANGHNAAATPELAEADPAPGAERLPYRKRFGYVAPARAARAARREG